MVGRCETLLTNSNNFQESTVRTYLESVDAIIQHEAQGDVSWVRVNSWWRQCQRPCSQSEFHMVKHKNPTPLPVFTASNFPFFFYTKMYKALVWKCYKWKITGNKTAVCSLKMSNTCQVATGEWDSCSL